MFAGKSLAIAASVPFALLIIGGCGSDSSASSTGSSPAPTPTGSLQPGSYSTCAQLYAKLAAEVLQSKSIPPATLDKWAKEARAAATAGRMGNVGEAQQICEKTTAEIEAQLH